MMPAYAQTRTVCFVCQISTSCCLFFLHGEWSTHVRCTNTRSCVTCLVMIQGGGRTARAYESKAKQNDIGTAASAGFVSPENLDYLFQSVPTVAIALARRQAQHVPKAGLAVSQTFYWTLLRPKICSELISSFILLQFAQSRQWDMSGILALWLNSKHPLSAAAPCECLLFGC